MLNSIWAQNSNLPSFGRLEHDIKTDVLIVGGGMAGILCAYMLHKAGIQYTLIEADTVCSGVSRNTTAKITSQHGLAYHKLLKNFGEEKALLYLQSNQEAVQKYKDICSNISCNFQVKDNYVYTTDRPDKIDKELSALSCIGYNAEFRSVLPIPLEIEGAVCFKDQAQFNPLDFVAAISKDLNIYENTTAQAFKGHTVITEEAKITTSKIIVATHFPIINKHGSYFLKMYQHRSYVLALENAADLDGMYVDEKDTGLSFRNYNDLLLLGGGGHRTGKQGGNWTELAAFALANYPKAREICRWATQDCMSLDSIPYIGQYSKNTPDLYVATGFNKWGMSSSMVSALLLCDMILEKDNAYAELYSPSRSMMHPQLALNALESTARLLTPSKHRCPHMGCALKWNRHERSWDCPCHGSRFDESGILLDNPSTGNLKN